MPLLNEKTVIGGKFLSVCSEDTYRNNRDILKDDDQAAVEINKDGRNFVLPIRNSSDDMGERPGVYKLTEGIDFLCFPESDEDISEYSPSGDRVLKFTDIKSMQDLIEKTEQFKNTTNQILESPDQLTKPIIKEADTPIMRGFKEAIIAKNIDIDKYSERFGVNFPNDKRKLNDSDITLFMLERFAQRLDMNIDVTISDSEGNIANPIGKKITVNIVPGINELKIENTAEEDGDDSEYDDEQ